jgi:hypothetical protein
MAWTIFIGIGAGLTTALLFAALATGQIFAVALFYLTPLPILIAGIAWSHVAAAIAAITSALLLGTVLGGWFMLTFLVSIGVPAYVLAYLAMLARPVGNGGGQALEWYPPGRLVLAAALIAAAAISLSIPAFGLDAESYRAGLKAAFERVLRAQTDTPAGQPLELPGTQDTPALLDFLALAMPPAAAGLSMITMLANLWLAGRIARISGRLARPWPDLGAMRFPAGAPLLLAAAIAGTFLPGLFGLVAGLLSATLLLAYAILGFAIIHGASRGLALRTIIVVSAWVAVLLLGWPLLLVVLLGVADTFIDLRARAGQGGPPNLPSSRSTNE